MQPRVDIAGVPVDAVDMAEAVAIAERSISAGECTAIVAVNPEKIIACRENPLLREALGAAELLIPDGIGAVAAMRLHGYSHVSRVPGSELMPALCRMAADRGYSVFLFGASAEVNTEACAQLRSRYPGLKIAGQQHGYVAENDYGAVIEAVNASGADILFVALGSPKQEYFINAHKTQLKAHVIQGVGGTFDVIAGRVKRAPQLWRKCHLEWLYRLLSQPSRLLRQTALPKFVWLVVLDLWRNGRGKVGSSG